MWPPPPESRESWCVAKHSPTSKGIGVSSRCKLGYKTSVTPGGVSRSCGEYLMETVAARGVQASELNRLDEVVEALGSESELAAVLNHIACNVRAGSDVVVAAMDDEV